MKTKGQNFLGFLLMVVLLFALAFVAAFGVGSFGGVFDGESVTLGLDLVGGSRIVYQADTVDTPSKEDMEAVRSMIRSRLDSFGYTEATAVLEGDNRIIVEIPSVANPEEAVQILGSTAKLEFLTANDEVVLSAGDVVKATQEYGPIDESGIYYYYVSLILADEAVDKFADATEAAAKLSSTKKNYISIVLDGEVQSQPYVTQRLETSSVIISGGFDKERAVWLAGVINSGQLPFALREIQMDSVDATLGDKALHTSLVAGGIGILLVMLFMIVFYRLPGVIASVSLIGYTASIGLCLCLFHINLSLTGIAGIILSIGMAVDANVIIFERMKEELRTGKSTGAALKGGFKRAITAILDSNITTLIAALVLLYFGTGSIQGFAMTLLLGVLLSMLFAVLVTRYLLSRLVGMRVTSGWLYGLNKKEAAK